MAHQNEVCENCGKAIGKLETPHLHDGHVVCVNCKAQLAPVAEYASSSMPGSGKSKQTTYVALGVGVLIVVGTAVLFLVGSVHTSPTRAPANPVSTPVVTVAPPQSAIASAILPPSKGSIAGSIWVEHKDGSSIPMRGIELRLIKTQVSPQTYYACIKSQHDIAARMAADDLKQAAESKQKYPDSPYMAETDLKSAAEEQQEATALQQLGITITTSSPATDAITVYQALASRSPFGLADIGPILRDNRVATVTSGADATYCFADVPTGPYYIYADKDTDVFNIEWLVPVTVKAGEQTRVDLYNNNAVRIHNKHH